MNSFKFLALVGFLLVIGVSCDDLKVIWNGDPDDLAEGYSYERFNFLTEVLVDKKDVKNTNLNWNTCSNYTGIDYFLNTTGSEACYGRILECRAIYTHFSIFRWIIGNDDQCRCLCNRLYDPKPKSHVRELLDSICLDEVMADVNNNYVLTGVRLHRLNNTLTFEIQEGKLENGIVLYDTIRWVPPPKNCTKVGKLTASKHTVVLDDVIFSEEIVATGVAFQRYSEIPQNESTNSISAEMLERDPFFLTVIGNPFDGFNLTKDCEIEKSVWDYSLKNRINLINNQMEISVALPLSLHNHVLSEAGKNYVTFDLAMPNNGLREFVIPYVDSQNVSDTVYPQIVKGIGLYYKGYEGYGGYIAPRIFVPAY